MPGVRAVRGGNAECQVDAECQALVAVQADGGHSAHPGAIDTAVECEGLQDLWAAERVSIHVPVDAAAECQGPQAARWVNCHVLVHTVVEYEGLTIVRADRGHHSGLIGAAAGCRGQRDLQAVRGDRGAVVSRRAAIEAVADCDALEAIRVV